MKSRLFIGLLLLATFSPAESLGFDYYYSTKGAQVRWDPCNAQIPYFVDANGTNTIAEDGEFDAILDMIGIWNDLPCSPVELSFQGRINNAIAQAGIGEDENHLVFVRSTWSHKATQVALTTLTYNPGTGFIFDADMEFNDQMYDFALCDAEDTEEYDVDFRYVVLHETGHIFGLNHPNIDPIETDPLPVMFVHNLFCKDSPPHDLTQDDIDGFCSYYGSGIFEEGCVEPQPERIEEPTKDVIEDLDDDLVPSIDEEKKKGNSTCSYDPRPIANGWWWVLMLLLVSLVPRILRRLYPGTQGNCPE